MPVPWPAHVDPLVSRDQPRIQLLHAIERTAPEAMVLLHSTLLPAFCSTVEELRIDLTCFNNLTLRCMTDYQGVFRHMRPLFYAWARGYNLADRDFAQPPTVVGMGGDPQAYSLWDPTYLVEWMLAAAIDTLGTWATTAESTPRWRLDRIGHEGSIPVEPFRCEQAGWVPTKLSKAEFMKRARADHERQLMEYVDKIESQLLQPGVSGEVMKRFPALGQSLNQARACWLPSMAVMSARFTPDHFDWLVRYQILREGYTTIAKSQGLGSHAVTKAVREIAKMIVKHPETWLRPSPKGRPNCQQ